MCAPKMGKSINKPISLGMQLLFVCYWGCETLESTYWRPNSLWDLITSARLTKSEYVGYQ